MKTTSKRCQSMTSHSR